MSEAVIAPDPEIPPPDAGTPGGPGAPLPGPTAPPGSVASSGPRPSFLFFGVVAAVALLADVASKAWAEVRFVERSPAMVLVENHLSLLLAYNRGGAWGLLQDSSEMVRRPFFLGVSVAAIVFIVSLYSRLVHGQWALKWGLPLVLGGALGNLTDRIVRTSVVDFIDYRAGWIAKMNETIARAFPLWNVTDHWPTFNVADICICTGVALMAIDMIASKHPPKAAPPTPAS